jgi:hypothetical protein
LRRVEIGFIAARTTTGCPLVTPPSRPPALFEPRYHGGPERGELFGQLPDHPCDIRGNTRQHQHQKQPHEAEGTAEHQRNELHAVQTGLEQLCEAYQRFGAPPRLTRSRSSAVIAP